MITSNAGIASMFCACLLGSMIPGDASAQCRDPKSGPGVPVCGDVPGTSYTLGRATQLIDEALGAVIDCNRESGWAVCQRVDRLLYDADVAIDQMLRECTPQSVCRNGSLTALCNTTVRLGRVARIFESNSGQRRSYDNSLTKIQSWLDTPLCSHTHATPTPAPVPAPAPSPSGSYHNGGGFACFGGATYPASWRNEASCNSYGCNFGHKSSAAECLRLGASKGATEVVYGVSGSRANECWLQNSCQDKRPHANFAYYTGSGAVSTPSPVPTPLPPPKPRPCNSTGYNPYGCN